MQTIFVLTSNERGSAGHGEPAPYHLVLATVGGNGYLGSSETAYPAFTSREKAEAYKTLQGLTSLTVKQLILI